MKKRNGFLIACVAAIALSGASCFGPFNATRHVWKFNHDVGGKWAQEGVFLVFIFLPVYGLASLADAIVFNSIEFWTGDNPISPPAMVNADQREFQLDGHTVRLEREDLAAGREMRIQIYEGDALVEEYRVSSTDHGPTLLKDADGTVLGSADTLPNGEVVLADATGQAVLRL